jgi:hypothetical protein
LKVEAAVQASIDGIALADPVFKKNRCKKNYHVIDGKRNGAGLGRPR